MHKKISDWRKKSMIGESTMIYLILVLILIAVMLIFQDRIRQVKEEDRDKEVCKTSVMQHAAMTFQGIDFLTDLDCSTEERTIKGIDRNAVKHELADAMYDCFDMWGQGKYEILSGPSVKNYCVICHVISFEHSMQIPAEDFANYLRATKVPNTGLYYEDYLRGYSTDSGALAVERKPYSGNFAGGNYFLELKKDSKYATVFTYLRKGYTTKLFSTSIGGVAGIIGGMVLTYISGGGFLLLGTMGFASGVAGGVIGYQAGSEKAQDWEANILLIPYNSEELKKMECEELPARQKTSSSRPP